MRPLATILFPTALFSAAVLCPLSSATAQGGELEAKTLFAREHLVRVAIELPPEDWLAMRNKTRSFSGALLKTPTQTPFEYVSGNVTIDGVRIENVGIRKKGFIGSMDTERPSLKIKFDEYIPFEQRPDLRIIGFDRLTLNNNKQDDTQLSQVFGYAMFRSAGLPAPRCNNAVVSVNGESLGIYSNVESLKRPFLKHAFGGDGKGDIFEGTIADFFPDTLERFEAKTKRSDPAVLAQVAAAADRRNDEGLSEIDLKELGRVLDVEAFLQFWAMESLISFWDGYTNNQNNYFVYRKPANGMLYFIPWGIDSAFEAPPPFGQFGIKHKAAHSKSVLANRLYQLPETQERYRTILEGLLKTVWDEDELLVQIDAASALFDGHLHPAQGGHDRDTRRFKLFVKRRRKVIVRELQRWPFTLREGPHLPTHFSECGVASGTFTTKWLTTDSADQAELQLVIEDEVIEFKSLKVSSSPSKMPGRQARGTNGKSIRPPTITFVGTRQSDGVELTLAFGVDADDFAPTAGKSVPVQGILLEGGLRGLTSGGFKLLNGTVEFKAAAQKDGAPVRGKFELRVLKKAGGVAERLER